MTDKYGNPAINIPEENEVEEWRDAPGYEDRYQISNFGNLRNKRNGYIRKLNYDKCGYPIVCLKRRQNNGNMKICCVYIHRLVCEAFNGPPSPDHNICDHRDRCIVNNYYKNLHWVNHRENSLNRKPTNKVNISLTNTPIIFFDLDGNYLQRFDSIIEAHKILNISKQQIQHNLRGTRQHFHNGFFKTEADYLAGLDK